MQSRPFRALGAPVPAVGLGAWQLGADWGDIEDAVADEILGAAMAGGVGLLDTADVYGGGRSERRIGAFLARTGWRPVVATKLGRLHGFPGPYERDLLARCIDDSCVRLGVDTLDLIQLHCVPDAVLEDGVVFDLLREQQAAGRVRAWGASVETVAQARTCLQQDGLASLQLILNVLRQDPVESGLLDACAHRGVAVLARLPLDSGLLAGGLRADSAFPETDHRHYNRDGAAFHVGETFGGLTLRDGLSLVEQVRAHVPAGWSMAGFALRWILDHPAVTVVIPGASRPEQVRANVAAADLPPLDADTHAALSALWREAAAPRVRGPR